MTPAKPTAATRIVLDGVSKRYDAHTLAVRDLSLVIEPGELLVLVGPSGCGKSTVLRLIAGLESPTSGRILFDGDDVTAQAPQQRHLAMVFQSYALYPHMTVRENMSFGLRVRGRPREAIDRQVSEAARALGLEEVLDRRPGQLSGGQRQRVALGRAIVREPRAFLLDEPLSNLDAQLRADTRAELARLHRRLGVTMVYVTHDQTEAMSLGTRVVVLREGVLQQVAPPLELYQRPVNRFVAGFIGTPAMNFLPGRLRRDGDGFDFVGSGLSIALPGGTQDRHLRELLPTHPVGEDIPGDAVLGIRPHDVVLGGHRPSASLVTTLVEPLGSEQIVHLALPEGGELIAVTRQTVREGEPTPVTIPVEAVHLFDRRRGERLSW